MVHYCCRGISHKSFTWHWQVGMFITDNSSTSDYLAAWGLSPTEYGILHHPTRWWAEHLIVVLYFERRHPLCGRLNEAVTLMSVLSCSALKVKPHSLFLTACDYIWFPVMKRWLLFEAWMVLMAGPMTTYPQIIPLHLSVDTALFIDSWQVQQVF